MTMFVPIAAAADRVMTALISGLAIEFGRDVGAALAARFLEAEGADFHWDARVRERWLGAYESLDDTEFELDRVAIMGRLDSSWFVAVMIVDGNGNAQGMLGCRRFENEQSARKAFADAR